ncbi:MAG: hypothetical protein ACT6QU_10150 [Aliihoeflea sp.]|uniref:hypothetical protein n=1 Tax=Aliihoeflea sp. TaxID=2608088 RepID=UPI004034C4E6
MNARRIAIAGSLVLLAGGCAAGAQSMQSGPVGAQPVMDESVPGAARDACLRKVWRTTNSSDLTILEMIYSEANSQLTIGVGPTLAPWQCTVSNLGVVTAVMSLTDEGAL